MALTRTQATGLLNQAEIGLYDDSRANAIRRLRVVDLERRIERARTARDRARDQLKRQKLASRSRTGSKSGTGGDANVRSARKAEVLADVLKRFEGQLKLAKQQERSDARAAKAAGGAEGRTRAGAAGRKAATPAKAVARKSPAGAAAKAGAPAKAASRRAASKTAAGAAPAPSAAGTSAPARPARRRGGISPEQALDNTRRLLEAKQEEARRPPAWQSAADGGEAAPSDPSFQSNEAQGKANLLHDAESRVRPIGGSMGTRDRINQGKRDGRRSAE